MRMKLTKAQSARLVAAIEVAEECLDALHLGLKKKKITIKDRAKFKSCLSKILGVKLKK